MLSVEPDLRMVDVSHLIPAQDVMEAAFVLRQVIPSYPPESVHLVVVDPGVGTERRAIAARFAMDGKSHRFVGPDNGVLPLLAGELVGEIVELDRAEAWFAESPSRTFHGRDVFGPVAARLAAGARLADVGTAVESVSAMHWPLPLIDDEAIDGMVLHVDAFGNCITNITAEDLDARRDGRGFKCYRRLDGHPVAPGDLRRGQRRRPDHADRELGAARDRRQLRPRRRPALHPARRLGQRRLRIARSRGPGGRRGLGGSMSAPESFAAFDRMQTEPDELPPPPRRSAPAWRVALVALLLAVVAGAAFWWLRPGAAEQEDLLVVLAESADGFRPEQATTVPGPGPDVRAGNAGAGRSRRPTCPRSRWWASGCRPSAKSARRRRRRRRRSRCRRSATRGWPASAPCCSPTTTSSSTASRPRWTCVRGPTPALSEPTPVDSRVVDGVYVVTWRVRAMIFSAVTENETIADAIRQAVSA